MKGKYEDFGSNTVHTILRAAAQQTEYVSVPTNDFHHFHLLNQICDVTVVAVICTKTTHTQSRSKSVCVRRSSSRTSDWQPGGGGFELRTSMFTVWSAASNLEVANNLLRGQANSASYPRRHGKRAVVWATGWRSWLRRYVCKLHRSSNYRSAWATCGGIMLRCTTQFTLISPPSTSEIVKNCKSSDT